MVLLLSHSNSKAQGSCTDYNYQCVQVFDDESNPLEGATIAYQFDYAGDFTDAGTALTESNGWCCDIPICMDYYDFDQGWNEDISGWIRTSHTDYPQGFQEYSFHEMVNRDEVRIYPLTSPPQKNIFNGVGNWSKVECWSPGRLLQPNDQVIIRGHCSMDMELPSELSSLIIEDTTIPLPLKLKKLERPEGKASLDMHRYALVNIPIIQNNGIILTQNRSKTPLPSGLKWQGLIAFNFHSILPILNNS